MTVREKYLRTIVFKDLKMMIELIINDYIPNIDKMKIAYIKNSNQEYQGLVKFVIYRSL